MRGILKQLGQLFENQKGQTLAEYALILVLIAIVVIVALTLLGVNITGILNDIAGSL